ncbi:MAG: hypothetical protein VYB08_04250, partial [Candidatus Latescibacterota bacterium]|nr:hypothetical protein [Candidatus Latescibacterota bacterium]
ENPFEMSLRIIRYQVYQHGVDGCNRIINPLVCGDDLLGGHTGKEHEGGAILPESSLQDRRGRPTQQLLTQNMPLR